MNNEAEMNTAMAGAQSAIESEAAAVGLVVPWLMIVQIFMQLITGCLAPTPAPAPVSGEKLKELAKNLGWYQTLRAHWIARRNLGWTVSHQTVVDTITVGQAAIEKMDPAHVATLAAGAPAVMAA